MKIDISGLQFGNIILDSTFTITFLVLLIFFYGQKIQELLITTQTDFLVDSLSKDLDLFADQDFVKNLLTSLPEVTPLPVEPYESVKNNAINQLIFIVSVGMGAAVLFALVFQVEIVNFISTNLISSFMVIAIVYFFITFVGRNFILIDPNLIRHRILSIIQQKIPKFELPSLDDIKNYLQNLALQKLPSQEALLGTLQSVPGVSQATQSVQEIVPEVSVSPAVQETTQTATQTATQTVTQTVQAVPTSGLF
jgi:hypothetical protein